MTTPRRPRPLRGLAGGLVAALVGASLALVAGPAVAVPAAGTQTQSCTGAPSGTFDLVMSFTADLQPGRTIAVGRTIALAGVSADLTVPAAVADGFRGGFVTGNVLGALSFLQRSTNTFHVSTPMPSFSGVVPASGPLVLRVDLGDAFLDPPGTGDVAVGAAAFAVLLTFVSPVGGERTTVTCQADRNNPGGLTDTVQVVEPVQQTVAFSTTAPSGAVIGATYRPVATASGGGPVTFASDTPAVCTVASGTVTTVAAGQCTVRATQAGDALTDPASSTQTFAVARKPQTVSFAGTPPSPARVGSTYQPRASASSGLPVTLSTSDPAVCTVEGGTVSLVAAGQCSVRADQSGDPTYAAAPRQTQTFAVTRSPQGVSFTSTPPSPARVDATYPLSATSTSGLPVTFGSATPAVCTVSGATATLVGAGQCTLTADQAGNGSVDPAPQQTQTFAVTRATQSPRFVSVPPSPAEVGATYAVRLDGGSSGNALTLVSSTPTVCTVLGTTVSLVAAGTCTISLTQDGSAAYEPGGPVTQSFTVTRVVTAVTVTAPAGAVSGQPLRLTATPTGAPAGTVQLTLDGAPVGAPVAYTGTPVPSATVATTAGNHVLGATFTPTDTVRFAPASATSPYVVDRAATTTAVAVGPGSVTATVTTRAPGTGTPTGSVRFLLDGRPLGTATLAPTADGARAVLPGAIPPGSTRAVTAVYDGDSERAGSTGTTGRTDPTITAVVRPVRAPSASGWYADRLLVGWVCASPGAALLAPCPTDAAVTRDGTTTLTRTVTTADGGSATATAVVRLDQVAPKVRLRGVGRAPGRPRCAATDATSGVASCRLRTTRRDGVTTVRAVARDLAGNRSVATRVVRRR